MRQIVFSNATSADAARKSFTVPTDAPFIITTCGTAYLLGPTINKMIEVDVLVDGNKVSSMSIFANANEQHLQLTPAIFEFTPPPNQVPKAMTLSFLASNSDTRIDLNDRFTAVVDY